MKLMQCNFTTIVQTKMYGKPKQLVFKGLTYAITK